MTRANQLTMYRAILAVRPRLLLDAIRERFRSESDVTVVGEVRDEIDLLLAVRATNANLVVHTWNDENMPAIYTHLFQEFPGLTAIGLTPGERVFLCEQRIVQTPLVDASIDDALDALRLEPLSTTGISV